MASKAQIQAFRRALANVNALAIQQLVVRWRAYDIANAAVTTEMLIRDLAQIADEFSAISADLALDFYEEIRTGAPFRPTPAPPPNPDQVQAIARHGAGPLWDDNPDPNKALSKIAGGLQRMVANGARDTLMDNARRDPAKPRAARDASPDSCAFCALLATRGAAYVSEETAGFQAHDFCNCTPVLVFPGEPYDEPAHVAGWRDAYYRSRDEVGGGTKPILAQMRKEIGTN